jgi:hypothetical protein
VGGTSWPAEYRGSIVGLQPDTVYDLELTRGTDPAIVFDKAFETWNDDFPIVISEIVTVEDRNTPLEIINKAGSENGYILYTGPATIDLSQDENAPYCIRIQNSHHIIIRGLTLIGGKDGIVLGTSGVDETSNNDDVHDIVIENNDISAWGTVREGAPAGSDFGVHDQSGIRSNSRNLERIVIQRNRIHDPRTDSNNGQEGGTWRVHPNGPQGITFEHNEHGSHVIRYNEIRGNTLNSRLGHYFNDGMGSDDNFGYYGFPGRDSDVYGNYITNVWDDAIESEGGNVNVRIWGNFTDETYVGVALAGTTLGPLYIFRNVFNHSRSADVVIPGVTDRVWYGGVAFKRGGDPMFPEFPSDGPVYIYNNTIFYNDPQPPDFRMFPRFQTGIDNRTDAHFAKNTVGRNNILQVRSSNDLSIRDKDASSSYDHNLFNGQIDPLRPPGEDAGIEGSLPIYISEAGFSSDGFTYTGVFQLSPGSPGRDQGVEIPNFAGPTPDIGAHESGDAPMQFGISAVSQVSGDYNANGTVDAADYVVWRKNSGKAMTLSNEDPFTTPGSVTADDYGIWRSHFGMSASPHARLTYSTPSPGALVGASAMVESAAAVPMSTERPSHTSPEFIMAEGHLASRRNGNAAFDQIEARPRTRAKEDLSARTVFDSFPDAQSRRTLLTKLRASNDWDAYSEESTVSTAEKCHARMADNKAVDSVFDSFAPEWVTSCDVSISHVI